jgi:hypothetical protein
MLIYQGKLNFTPEAAVNKGAVFAETSEDIFIPKYNIRR